MANLTLQASFNSGEWAPQLYARVDIQKYRSGAALMENFTIDYRGGASTRMGTRYVLQAYKSSIAVRLIPFQASFNIGYVLEFGDHYIRFFFQGAPIIETGFAVTGIARANLGVVTATGNDFATGDWVFVNGVVGMTQVDNRYFSVLGVAGAAVTLGDLNGNALDTTAYTAYASGGTISRVYTLASPYAAADLGLVKFAQITNEMVLCHPSYAPQLLTLVTATNWTINPITFGSTAQAPTGVTVTSTLGGGSTNYSYVVTSLDASGQESGASTPASLLNKQDIRSVAGSNKISWSPVAGAEGYNVYESSVSYFGVVPIGINYGFIGTTKGTTLVDSNIGPNFAESPPIEQNPFVGSGISFIAITGNGTYTTVPTITFTGGTPIIAATAIASLGVLPTPAITAGGSSFVPGDTINFGNGVVMTVVTVSGGAITAWVEAAAGSITSGTTPTNPVAQVSTSGSGTGATATFTWGVVQAIVLTNGAGYTVAPTVVFSAGAATATATLQPASNGNPSVPSFYQQRLVLAAPPSAPQTFYMSQPGNYFNYNINDPVEADDAITETLVSGVLQTVKSIVSVNAGMLVLTDKATWIVNGGSSGSGVSPTAIVANLQSTVGASDVPPIVANYDVLFVQSKGSAVRDNAYNIYFNVFTGTDISVTSSHLFYGFNITEWAWAEQPFYVVWAVRNDGVMLTLTFLKEQEFVGWTHQTTQGLFKSVCTVTESTTDAGNVDAVYVVVQRTVNGNTVKYIERISDRAFPNGLSSAWCVDAGVQYSGAPALSFTGAEQLAGLSVTGLATDNLGNVVIVAPFVMPVTGFFTLPAPLAVGATGWSTVTIGLGFVCDLQTLAIDVGQAPMQGKVKKIAYVDARVNETLGLQIGANSNSLVNMKDLQQGAISSMAVGLEPGAQLVNGLYSGDARTWLDPSFNVYGQYYLRQPNPYPATILGLFSALEMGDTD